MNKIFEDKKIVYGIIFLFLLISSLGLSFLLYDDEAFYAQFFDSFEQGEYPAANTQPVALTAYYFVLWIIQIFSGGLIPLRLLGLLIGAMVLFTTYRFAEEVFDKKIALTAITIMAVSFYFMLASLRMDVDGNVLTLFITLSFYFYFKSIKEKNLKWPILSGITAGIAILFKYSSAFILISILIYEIFFNKKEFKTPALIGGVSVGTALLFPLVTFITGRLDILNITISHGVKNASRFSLETMPMILIKHTYKIIQYGTPVLFFLPMIAVLLERQKEKWLFVLWALAVLMVFVVGSPLADVARYHMMMIPALAILTAVSLNRIFENEEFKHILKTGAVLFLGVLFIIIALNLFSGTQTPFSFQYLNSELIPLNPDVWYTGTSGPAFNVSLFSLLFVSIISALMFACFFLIKNTHWKTFAAIVLIASSFAFNVFLIEEYLFFGLSPNYSQTMQEMIDYYKENNLKEPLFSIDEDFPYYLGIKRGNYHDIEKSEEREFLKGGGTVLYLNLDPTIYSLMWQDVEDACTRVKTFYSGGYEAGFIYSCPKS